MRLTKIAVVALLSIGLLGVDSSAVMSQDYGEPKQGPPGNYARVEPCAYPVRHGYWCQVDFKYWTPGNKAKKTVRAWITLSAEVPGTIFEIYGNWHDKEGNQGCVEECTLYRTLHTKAEEGSLGAGYRALQASTVRAFVNIIVKDEETGEVLMTDHEEGVSHFWWPAFLPIVLRR